MCCCGAQLPPQFDAAASATASSLLYMYMMSCRPGLQLMMGLILLHPLPAPRRTRAHELRSRIITRAAVRDTRVLC